MNLKDVRDIMTKFYQNRTNGDTYIFLLIHNISFKEEYEFNSFNGPLRG